MQVVLLLLFRWMWSSTGKSRGIEEEFIYLLEWLWYILLCSFFVDGNVSSELPKAIAKGSTITTVSKFEIAEFLKGAHGHLSRMRVSTQQQFIVRQTLIFKSSTWQKQSKSSFLIFWINVQWNHAGSCSKILFLMAHRKTKVRNF